MSVANGGADGVRVAVVGAGWAGCAAAVELVRLGYQVTLLEAARTPGGRARSQRVGEQLLDNGQHILLGAYRDCLRLMRSVGVDVEASMLRLPLQMRYPAQSGGMDFAAPRLPAPLHLMGALLLVRGLARADKLALIRFRGLARWMGWQLDTDCPVDQLLERFEQTPRLIRLLWHPLCIAALNTPPARASSNAFLAVLRDSLGANRRADSDMLLPRQPLGQLFPEPAVNWLIKQGAEVRLGTSVKAITPHNGSWSVELAGASTPAEALLVDALILATPASTSATLLADLGPAKALAAQLAALAHEPIASCYLQYPPHVQLPHPIQALLDDPERGRWGQFVFDRGLLDAQHAGLLAVVVSAAADAAALSQAELAQALAQQLADDFQRPELAAPLWSRLITDKRATFACDAGVLRAPTVTPLPGLLLAGDYTDSDYPATLETAVRSGMSAASLIAQKFPLSRKKRSLSQAAGAA